jgi:hypothetical protein
VVFADVDGRLEQDLCKRNSTQKNGIRSREILGAEADVPFTHEPVRENRDDGDDQENNRAAPVWVADLAFRFRRRVGEDVHFMTK